MDPIFQSLLLKQSSTASSTNKNDGSGNGSGRQQPRPSRYAQLIPREALRQPTATPSTTTASDDDGVVGEGLSNRDGRSKKKKKKKQQHQNQRGRRSGERVNGEDGDAVAVGGDASKLQSTGGDGSDRANNQNAMDGKSNIRNGTNHAQSTMEEDDIRVYRMDGATGQMELLPEDDYNLVYHSDDEDGDGGGDLKDENKGVENGENGMNADDGASNKGKIDVADKAEDDAMDVDEKEDKTSSSQDKDNISNINEKTLDNEDTIYIIKGPAPSSLPTFNYLQSNQEIIDTASSSSDSDDIPDSAESNGNTNNFIPIHPRQRSTLQSREASASASTLARALVSRTDGFDKLRPGYNRLLEEEKSREDKNLEEKKKKKEKKEKKNAKSSSSASSSSSSSSKGKEELKQPQPQKKEGDNADDANIGERKGEPTSSATFVQSQKLISSLPPAANVLDGDSARTLLQLSRMRRWQEEHIEPCMQGMELDNWEDGIDWEGGASSGDDEDKKKEDSMDVDEKAKDFKPPEPLGGHPKRLRRALPEYDDPIQLLLEPRNPRLEALDLSTAVDWEGAYDSSDSNDRDDEDEVNVPLILQSSVAGRSVASLLAPCAPSSRPPPFESHPSYQARYDREINSDVNSTADLVRPGLGMPGENTEKLEKFKEARQRKREQMAKDKQSRVTEVMSALSLTGTGRRITSSLMGPGGAERTGRPSRHALGGSSSAHDAEYVEQLELVYNHTLVKPDLCLSEYRQFHRPRLPLIVVSPSCPWQFQTRVITEKKRGARGGAKGGGGATNADGSTVVGSYHAMMSSGSKAQNKIRNEADLSPTLGDLVVMEYSEERPPLLMTKGMTCRIVNYYRGDRSRCPISAGGGDRPLRKRHGDKAASAATPNAPASGPSNRVERPPRLVGPNQYAIKSAADLIGISSIKKKKKSKEAAALEAKKAKENAIDVLPEGVTEILHQKVHGPFIGEVEEGKTQSGLISNLFAAPLFQHESEPTDFLMILGQVKDKTKSSIHETATGGLGVVLRPLPPSIYCVGQTEPRVKVFAPNTNDEKKFVNAFVPYQVSKNIERTELQQGRGLTFDDIKDRLFANTTIPHGQLRIRIKQVANFERSNNGIWSLKALGEDGFPGVEALGRKVSPEGVAAYESQCAAIRRLQDLGLKELYSGGNTVTNVAAIMIFLNGAVQAAMERRLKMKKVLEMKKRQKSSQLVYFEKAFEKLDAEYKELKKRQEIAKFIYEELQLSPWNISGEFIDVHKRAVGGAMMKLTGIGDPSGVGEAYNFLREADSRSSKVASSNNDGALNAQIKKITGTQNDLRKLTMKQMASLLRSYGMKDKQIGVLKRWDRVHVIRDLSTKAASDGMGDEMERFARGEKLRLSDQRQNYKERIQEIWRRQIMSLTADAGNEAAATSDLGIGSVKDTNDVDEVADAAKENEDESDSDSEDDDFAAMMEMEMSNTGEANRLMTAQLRDNDGTPMRGGLDSQELSKDAREFAALQRQREEERAMQEGFDQKGSASGMGMKPKKKFKVIRRKITKTRPDGTQTVTFEFIVNRDKVDEIIMKKKMQEIDEKKRNERKKKKKIADDNHADEGDTCVGHAMFEDDDNVKTRRTNLKLKIKKETRLVHRKAPGPKKASHSKFTSSIKHSRAQVQETRKKKRIKQQEEADLYKSHVKGKGTSNRKERGSARERMPHVVLSGRLEAIRSEVENRKDVGPFLKPVSRTGLPHYYENIKEPIDLQTIREKNRKYEYNTADKFVAHFELMKENAIKFNGAGSMLAREAEEIYEFVERTVEQNRLEFDEMEDAVKKQMTGRKKKKSKKTGSSSSSKATKMNTANVVLDGISTQVNLGNLDFGLGGDSDSDDS